MRQWVGKLLEREGYRPGWLGLFVNPFYFARRGLYVNIRQLAPAVRGRVLDVGCGKEPYRDLFSCEQYVGMEIDDPAARRLSRATVFYDGHRFPFDDNSFDTVLAFEVFEHVFNPDEFLAEARRVLAPSGSLLLTTPLIWDEHHQPLDYGRYTSFGLAHLLRSHGFEVVELRKTVGDVRIIFQLINLFLYKRTVTPSPVLNLFLAILLMAPFNLAGAALGLILPRNPDLYLNNVVHARKRSEPPPA